MRIINKLLLVIFIPLLIHQPIKAEEDMKERFGVLEFLHWDHDWNYNKYSKEEDLVLAAQLMNEAGIRWVRFDFLWQDIEPEKGRFDFEKYDRIVRILKEYNIGILGILNYGVGWASSGGSWNCPADNNQDFVNFCVKVVKRYKDTVKHWEIWNEPDSHIYWSKQDGLKSYCALLKEVYPAIKAVDPDCLVLNGGLAKGISSVNLLYDNGAKEYFDILNIHIFESPNIAGAINRVAAYPKLAHKIMLKNNDLNKKIWITEIGSPGVKKGVSTDNWWMGANPNEADQANWLRYIYEQLLLDDNVDKIFWAFFRDCNNHWQDGTDYFGLVRWDFSRKPSFSAYKELSQKY